MAKENGIFNFVGDVAKGAGDIFGGLAKGVGEAAGRGVGAFGQSLTADLRANQAAIAGQKAQTQKAQFANFLQGMQIIAQSTDNDDVANFEVSDLAKRLGLPVPADADFTPFLKKFRQKAPTAEQISAAAPAGGVASGTTAGGIDIKAAGATVAENEKLEFKAIFRDGKNIIVGLSPTTGKEVSVVGDAPPNTTLQIVQDPADPDKFKQVLVDEAGNVVKELGLATPKQVKEGVAPDPIESGTKTQLEKQIVDLTSNLQELATIEEQFDPNFFTFRGKIGSGLTAFFEKAEIPTSEGQKEFLAKRSKFFADSKRVFLKFRKFITGVAGGIKEFKEIAKASIDPEKDSPTQFQAKFKSVRDNAIRLKNLMSAIRQSGFEPTEENIKSALNGISIEDIPAETVEGITLDALKEQSLKAENLNPEDLGSFSEEQLQKLLETFDASN
jgi:hypothetical protein